MILFLHGAAGGWDELIIAVVAFGVLWFAVKLAGRRPAQDEVERAASDEAAPQTEEQDKDPAHRRATKLS